MIIDLQWIWKEMVVAGFEIMSLLLAEGSKENHEKTRSGRMVSGV
jgi:hypothetical protein